MIALNSFANDDKSHLDRYVGECGIMSAVIPAITNSTGEEVRVIEAGTLEDEVFQRYR